MENSSSKRPSSEQRSSSARSHLSAQKPPMTPYETSDLMTNTSPLLTSSLHSRNSATSAQESAYLKQAQWLRWIRLAFILLTIATGTAALGCAGHVLQRYNDTHLGSNYHLPLWPRTVDLRPTLAVLIPAAIITAASLVYLVVSLIPTPYSRTLLCNIIFMSTSVIGLILCLFALSFNLSLVHPSNHHQRESLQSWTCKFSDGTSQFMSDSKSLQLPVYVFNGIPIPAGFKRLCMESQVSVGLVVALLVLEAFSCAIAGMGIFLEKKMSKARKQRYADGEKSGNMS